ncbi:hypothetical protein HNP84_004491 [Thermocatellispora tengchongensis]|uniref:DUF4240 domain-containing protein n=1 Tax=Thermocatellispora tengchongensis TaxID=1073253 RepID=A0A840PC51_9ACTN|nr:DUF4240 domain-containing protein [Thermocatellispora tengchongensis]MBB5134757.1 hypothetical protein [Thermocatellispora tengchongensis]
MDLDGFWELIERSGRETETKAARTAWLQERLSALPVEDIIDYERWWTLAANRGCSWDMYAVFWALMGRGSSDGFEYFVNWLIGMGRDAFEAVADNPDRVMELPQVRHVLELRRSFFRGYERTTWSKDGRFRLTRITSERRSIWTNDEWPEFEMLGCVSFEPYEKATGLGTDSLGEAVRARGIEAKFPFITYHAEPGGDSWDLSDKSEFIRRLPQVARYRGIS